MNAMKPIALLGLLVLALALGGCVTKRSAARSTLTAYALGKADAYTSVVADLKAGCHWAFPGRTDCDDAIAIIRGEASGAELELMNASGMTYDEIDRGRRRALEIERDRMENSTRRKFADRIKSLHLPPRSLWKITPKQERPSR